MFVAPRPRAARQCPAAIPPEDVDEDDDNDEDGDDDDDDKA